MNIPAFSVRFCLLALLFLLSVQLASASVFIDTTASDFNAGDYNQTQSTADGNVILSINTDINYYVSGDFNSQKFNALGDANWQKLLWNVGGHYGKQLPDNNTAGNQSDANMTGNVLLYHMDEASGTIVDYSGNGNNGTQGGGVTYGASGKFNTALSLDGSDDRISISPSSNFAFGTGNFAIGQWVYVVQQSDVQDYAGLVSHYLAASSSWFTELKNSVNYNYGFFDGASHIDSGVTIKYGQWVYFVVVRRGTGTNQAEMYVDGVLVKQWTNTQNYASTTNKLWIGNLNFDAYPTQYRFKGRIDEVAIWNRSLSATEVLNLYKRGVLRLKLQVRSCNDSACNGETFVGPDGNAGTFFTDSNTANDLNILARNQYFQYRAVFETDDVNSLKGTTPQLLDVNITYNSLISPLTLSTYLGSKPQGFFGPSQDVNIIADGNSMSIPNITITDANGNTKVNAQAMTDKTIGDTNRFQYTYHADANTGWFNVQVSNETFNQAFYQSSVWNDSTTSPSGTGFPFQIDVNATEPNRLQRHFALVEIPLDFNYLTTSNGVRVLDYNGTNYLEIPSQLYGKVGSPNVSRAVVAFLSSFDKNQTKQFKINYTKATLSAPYTSDLNLQFSNNVYSFDNSQFRTLIDLNKGGMISGIWNRNGSDTNIAGLIPMQYSPEARAGPVIYSASALTNPTYSLDENGPILSKITVKGTVGGMDYNTAYWLYAKQPRLLEDINVQARSNETWNYYYDDYLFYKDGAATKFVSYINSTPSVVTVSTGTGTGAASLGDINYWGLYNTSNADGLGTIFIERNSTTTPSIASDFYDQTNYEYWTHRYYTGGVTSASKFNSRIARSIFNAWNGYADLNNQYFQLANPLQYSIGRTATNDTQSPSVVDYNHTPFDSNDVADVNIWVRFSDNLQVDYVDINISGPDTNIQTRQTFTDANVVPNYKIDANVLNAGRIDANFRAYDIAGNATLQQQNFTVTDKTAPNVWRFHHTPDDNFSVDPGKRIRFDANITEYTGIRDANLLIRWYYDNNSSWSDWNSVPLGLRNQPTDYNYNYDLNFLIPSDLNKRFQYKIYSKDLNGNDANTDTNTFFAYHDYNWVRVPETFTTVNGPLDTNISIGDLNITNNADIDLNFKITTNWSPATKAFIDGNAIGLNGYTTENISPGQTISMDVNVTTKSDSESQDTLILTITPNNSLAVPTSQTASGTVISSAGGPFMYVEIPAYPVAVTQGDSNQFVSRVTNKGNQTANGVDLNWTLPTGWSITSGTASVSQSSLAVDASLTNTVTVLIPASATIGNQTVTATADTDGNAQKTRSTSVIVLVQTAGSATTTTTTTIITGGGGGGGGGGGSDGNNSIFQTPEQAEEFFKTGEETFELLRGKDKAFKITVQNPFEKQTLQKMRVSVSGLLSKYLRLSATELGTIEPKKSKSLTIFITAPKYFTSGKHVLQFTIEGIFSETKGNKTIDFPFKEERTVTLIIREVDKKTVQDLLKQAQEAIDALQEKGWETEKLVSLKQEAAKLVKEKKYEEVVSLVNEILKAAQLADATNQKIIELESSLSQAKENGLDAPKTIRLLELVKLAFKRGDYAEAAQQIEDASTVFLLETKGALNLTFFAVKNWKALSITGIVFLVLLFFASLFARYGWLSQRIGLLKKEETLILGLIKAAQDQCFVEKKLSMGEYYDTITHFEKKLSRAVEKTISRENERTNLFKFKSKSGKLREERQNLLENVKRAQEEYFNFGIIETRIFQAKTKSLLARYSEVEKNIVLNDTIMHLRLENSAIKPFWKLYYKVFK